MTERWWDEEDESPPPNSKELVEEALNNAEAERIESCLLYTSPSPRDVEESRMPSSA